MRQATWDVVNILVGVPSPAVMTSGRTVYVYSESTSIPLSSSPDTSSTHCSLRPPLCLSHPWK